MVSDVALFAACASAGDRVPAQNDERGRWERDSLSVVIEGRPYRCEPCRPGTPGCGEWGPGPGPFPPRRKPVAVSVSRTTNATVEIQLIDTSTGQTAKWAKATGDWDVCRKNEATLKARLGTELIDNRLAAICTSNATVIKLLANAQNNELKVLEEKATGDWDACRRIEADYNKLP